MKKEEKIELRRNILRLISGSETLILEGLNGKNLFSKIQKTFPYYSSSLLNWGFKDNGVATSKTEVIVNEIYKQGRFTDIFGSLDGTLEQKVLSFNQVIRFCEKFPFWLKKEGQITMFLAKINENKQINEQNLNDNLVVFYVRILDGELCLFVHHFIYNFIWESKRLFRVVSPKLIP